MKYDIYLVGVGGQGILTVGEILAGAAQAQACRSISSPAGAWPSAAGSSRPSCAWDASGSGRTSPSGRPTWWSPWSSPKRSRPSATSGRGAISSWWTTSGRRPTSALGKAPYPELEAVRAAIAAAGRIADRHPAEALPAFEGQTVQANIFVLGVAMRRTRLGEVFTPAEVEQVIQRALAEGCPHQPLRIPGRAGLPAGPGGRAGPMSLDALFYPRGVAVVGSMSAGKLGCELVKQMQAGGYAGALYAVNPKAEGYAGVPGFTSVAGIGRPVDLAVVVSPPRDRRRRPGGLRGGGRPGGRGRSPPVSPRWATGPARRRSCRWPGSSVSAWSGPTAPGSPTPPAACIPTLELRPPAGERGPGFAERRAGWGRPGPRPGAGAGHLQIRQLRQRRRPDPGGLPALPGGGPRDQRGGALHRERPRRAASSWTRWQPAAAPSRWW